jgi:ribonuclease HI
MIPLLRKGVKVVPIPPPCFLLKFDGCSKGNPGPAGAGAVLYFDAQEIWAGKQFVGKKETNNYAEYKGLILGLNEAVRRNIGSLCVCGDSMLVIKQMRGEYHVRSENLVALFAEATKIANQIETIAFLHIYREENKRADELSNLALELDPESQCMSD